MKQKSLSKTRLNALLPAAILSIGLAVTSLAKAADEIDLSKLQGDVQQKFENISKDVHALIAYEDSQPAVSKSGLIPFGFEFGFNASQISLKSTDEFKEVGFDISSVLLPRLYAEINIFSVGVAATYTPLYEGVSITGYKAKYSILDGSTILPALSINLNYASLNGVETLESSAFAYNLGISKGFAFITLYGNLGLSHGSFDPRTDTTLNLKKVDTQELDVVIGGRMGLFAIANIGVQLHSLGSHQSGTLNFGINF